MQFKVWVSTGYVGSKRETTITIDDEDLEGMDEYEKDVYIEGYCQEAMFEMIEWNFEELK
jgi:hypothetical protein